MLTKCEVDYESAWKMPVAVRRWWLNQERKDEEERKKEFEKGNRGKPPPRK
jgi:hypothetical protein